MTLRSVFAGALALAALQVAVSSRQAAGRLGQLAEWSAASLRAALSPATPLVPDLRPGSKTTPSKPTVGGVVNKSIGDAIDPFGIRHVFGQ